MVKQKSEMDRLDGKMAARHKDLERDCEAYRNYINILGGLTALNYIIWK